ncbi:DUF5681 domain-containing protein [Humidesulfovibrio mexicanus]|uniref:DUF5681 domain-containing protein n=1 Tax=Humidesulfovibrio mexicanus TaxID=147047 RepID=UPI0015C63929|nr:DUF5681 domain-containing protein [Humidesulfovibrio mexicanus]
MAENTAKKQRGKPFPKGTSGNPKGKPKGARNKASMAVQELLDGEGTEIIRKVIEMAKEGDVACLKLCLERLCPTRKDSPLRVTLPPLKNHEDIHKASKAILLQVAKGEITPGEGQAMLNLIETHTRVVNAVGNEEAADTAYSTISPEEMAERAANRRAAIEQQREEFLPERRLEVQKIKDEMVKDSFE